MSALAAPDVALVAFMMRLNELSRDDDLRDAGDRSTVTVGSRARGGAWSCALRDCALG
jgi:hypothetical protein